MSGAESLWLAAHVEVVSASGTCIQGIMTRRSLVALSIFWRTTVEMPLIVSNPAVIMGKPVIAGTRITVDLILEKMASGETIDQLLEARPRLTRESIFARSSMPRGFCDPTSYILWQCSKLIPL